jgi:UPF0176 protein
MSVVVAALYKFVAWPDYQDYQEPVRQACEKFDIHGTLLLAAEGINGTICGSRSGIDQILSYLKSLPGLAELTHKESFHKEKPFYRMRVRLKKEIVTLGVPGIDPNKTVGTYVKPKDWNAIISDPDVVLIDTRNDYEVEIGTFEHAVDPHTKTFREFPDYVESNLDPAKQKKVAMFCTGGIRCEKASSYMLEQGFEEVYHLEGGILKYLEEVPEEESLWKGECFVFDDRVAVDHSLSKGEYELCHGCRMPVSAEERQSPLFVEGVVCPKCHDTLPESTRRRAEERQRQMELARQRGEQHLGKKYDHE